MKPQKLGGRIRGLANRVVVQSETAAVGTHAVLRKRIGRGGRARTCNQATLRTRRRPRALCQDASGKSESAIEHKKSRQSVSEARTKVGNRKPTNEPYRLHWQIGRAHV